MTSGYLDANREFNRRSNTATGPQPYCYRQTRIVIDKPVNTDPGGKGGGGGGVRGEKGIKSVRSNGVSVLSNYLFK